MRCEVYFAPEPADPDRSLKLRGRRWHYVRHFPKHVAHWDQRGTIGLSLKTQSLEVARIKRDEIEKTAIIAVLRTGERPPLSFWVACATGFCAVLYFADDKGGGHLSLADGWLFLGMLSLGIAYVEGGGVSRELGGTAP